MKLHHVLGTLVGLALVTDVWMQTRFYNGLDGYELPAVWRDIWLWATCAAIVYMALFYSFRPKPIPRSRIGAHLGILGGIVLMGGALLAMVHSAITTQEGVGLMACGLALVFISGIIFAFTLIEHLEPERAG